MIGQQRNQAAWASRAGWFFSRRRRPAIGFLPAGDESTASSRLRVYSVARALVEARVATQFAYAPGLDVLVVQKALNDEVVEVARRAKADGCLLVYDVDDLGDALGYWTTPSLLELMLQEADLVLTATEEQRDRIRELGRTDLTATLPCPIDYYPAARPVACVRTHRPLRVLWFGSYSNIGLLEPYLTPLQAMKDVQPVVVTSAESLSEFSARHPAIECVAWSLDSFVTVLRGADVTLLMHDGTAADRAKSNNKMVTSIAWGIPAVVSRTPDYSRTAVELGVEGAVFDGPGDFMSAIDRLREPRARAAYLKRAQARVWRRYSAPAIARQLLRLLVSAKRAHGTASVGKPPALGGLLRRSAR